MLQEPMVVLLQMQQDNYLNKPRYSALTSKYPRPTDLHKNLRRGDFDLLFVHLRYGLIVTEVKSVGWRPGERDREVGLEVVGVNTYRAFELICP